MTIKNREKGPNIYCMCVKEKHILQMAVKSGKDINHTIIIFSFIVLCLTLLYFSLEDIIQYDITQLYA
jgi:hypothetical protein